MAHRLPSICSEGSSCRLNNNWSTVVAIASLAKGRNLLPVGNQGLEYLFGVQVALSQCMLKADGISTAKFMVWIEW